MIYRSAVLGALVLAVVTLGLTACARETTKKVGVNVPVSDLAGTWRGNGRVSGDVSGPIELKIARDGSFTGTAAGAVVSGMIKTTEGGEITFSSVGPRQGATGELVYVEQSGGKALLRGSGTGKYAGQQINFELARVQ